MKLDPTTGIDERMVQIPPLMDCHVVVPFVPDQEWHEAFELGINGLRRAAQRQATANEIFGRWKP